MTAFADPEWDRRIDRNLENILSAARHGTLDADWRSSLPAALSQTRRTAVSSPLWALGELPALFGRPTPVAEAEADILAVCELVEAPLWDWEPLRAPHVGTHQALNAWYLTCLALLHKEECEAMLTNVQALTDVVTLKSHNSAAMIRINALRRQTLTRQRDCLVESFEAAATFARPATNADWVGNSRIRVMRWPDDEFRTWHLEKLDDPAYRAEQEQLPAYWCS